MIAALYVAKNGSYINVPGIDPWPEDRDARIYRGPHPVVAHPPCQRWGKLWAGQPLHIKRTGIRKIKGDDGGCFERALRSVRLHGGILEHPCDSHAWAAFNLNKPPRGGGWIAADLYGGWTCCVEQGRYGHYARKPTWLYAVGCELPELDWGKGEPRLDPAVIERMGYKRAQRLGEVGGRGGGKDSAPRISTPAPFRDLLISIAKSASASSQGPRMRPICRNCEYFDCEGRDQNALPLEYRGDCLNPNAPGFQTGPDEKCSFFFPDTTRLPKGDAQ